jgi:deoxyribodipyrimidine photolyase-related protein
VLGDQLSDTLTSLRDLDPGRDLVLMAEVMAETTYVKHHKHKLVLVLSAMRQFADRLGAKGVTVRYVRLSDPSNSQTLDGELRRALDEEGPFERVVVTEPGEWRLAEVFAALRDTLGVPLEIRPDRRFIASHRAFAAWAKDKRSLTMEFFYRQMRRQTGLLMRDGDPAGGRWNYDAKNRKRLPANIPRPKRRRFPPNPTTRAVMSEVAERFPENFGTLDTFDWPTNHEDAEAALQHFLQDGLPGFGDWQDAMAAGEAYLWHGLVSSAINIGLLDPLEVCRRAEAEWTAGRVELHSAEGFIRQILGWREFVRGVYWLKGPDYKKINALNADQPLPSFYWSGETDMACVADVVAETRDHAYAHHIQRLMVTGNLAMLLGVRPEEINDWYMVVFIDAFEWVELPNTHGMATFADGGIVGSKPYAASGAYINRMSDYCGRCRYEVKEQIGENACPFNSLYWDFLMRNETRLRDNGRMAFPYKALDRMDADRKAALREQAETVRDCF